MNSQPIRKKDEDKNLQLVKVFHTLQGEGPYAGRPATFIRLHGCVLCCPNCDTEYDKPDAPRMNTEAILDLVAEVTPMTTQLVVITGGEPFRQNIVELVESLLEDGYEVQIETNGTVFREVPEEVTIVCSPKVAFLAPELLNHEKLYFKYVLDANQVMSDGLPASALGNKGIPMRPPADFPNDRIFLQPMDAKNPDRNRYNVEHCVRLCENNGYRLSLQLHKILGLE